MQARIEPLKTEVNPLADEPLASGARHFVGPVFAAGSCADFDAR
jgi:hypothetical protein